MGKLLGLIAGPALPYVLIGFIALAVAAWGAFAYRGHQLTVANRNLTTCNQTVGSLQSSLAGAEASIAAQNLAVQELQAAAEKNNQVGTVAAQGALSAGRTRKAIPHENNAPAMNKWLGELWP